MTTPATTPADGELHDDFRGDDANLVSCIKALISLSDEGALVPHGIGGHARALLSAAAVRLSLATPSPGKADAEDAARWRHARKAFWINGDPADVLCSSDADKAIDADMARDKQ